ncbi:MAG: DUF4347 domain-containing protein [Microcoleaceae cyanobacterium]
MSPLTASRSSLIFLDLNVSDCDQLLAGLSSNVEAVVLSSLEDGLEQITRYLHHRSRKFRAPETIHLVCYGSPGSLQLGNSQLSLKSLDRYARTLRQWRKALGSEVNLILYGCEVAAGRVGQAFIRKLQYLTGLEVITSTQKIGNYALGGVESLMLAS